MLGVCACATHVTYVLDCASRSLCYRVCMDTFLVHSPCASVCTSVFLFLLCLAVQAVGVIGGTGSFLCHCCVTRTLAVPICLPSLAEDSGDIQ